ncbi:hypothetical protein AK812_SmicGene14169 [Symbiodinium microadriaticum]|uniref:Uncharacterized protein n=1 Tax=Symbiodinium microadriaticum TaxID=2951 RepID=A0A1Q9E693_SYMMI|nr:hypothetical protein AK812_SmicGene14169 [Symbiodinium microadriaticum]
MAVSGKTRALSRPTSASTRPPSAGSVREGSPGLSSLSQRPTSAGSTSASLYRPTSAGTVQGSEVSSRPVSAKSQAGPVNTTTCRASLEAEESVNTGHTARGDSPSRGGRLLGPHSQDNAITQSSDFSRRAVEEELQQPVLTPIPNSIATPLERQMGTAIGLKGRNRLVPRLPRDVVQCLHGQNCCWRWLARAAMEEIYCGSLACVSLADGVTMMKEELVMLREEHAIKETERGRAEAAEENLASLKQQLAAAKVDHKEFRALERAHGHLQEEAASLRVSRGSLLAQLEVQKKDSAREIEAIHGKADAEASALRLRAEHAETELAKLQATESELRQTVAGLIQGREEADRKKLSTVGPRRFRARRGRKSSTKKDSGSRSQSRRGGKQRGRMRRCDPAKTFVTVGANAMVVVNCYMKLLQECSEGQIWCANTFFWNKLEAGGHAAVQRWTRRETSTDLFVVDGLEPCCEIGERCDNPC